MAYRFTMTKHYLAIVTGAVILFCIYPLISGASVPKKGFPVCLDRRELDMLGDEQMFLYERVNNDPLVDQIFGEQFPDGFGILLQDCTIEEGHPKWQLKKPGYDPASGTIIFDVRHLEAKKAFRPGPTPLFPFGPNIWVPISEHQARVFITELHDIPYAFLMDRRTSNIQHLLLSQIPGFKRIMQLHRSGLTLKYRTCKEDENCEGRSWSKVAITERDARQFRDIQFDKEPVEQQLEMDIVEDSDDGAIDFQDQLVEELKALMKAQQKS